MKAKTVAALKFPAMLLAVLFAAATLASVMAGTTERVSISTEGYETNPWSWCVDASISPDGRYVAFDSTASNLFPGAPPDGTETNRTPNIFIRDRGTDGVLPSTIRVTYALDGGAPDGYCMSPSISENGLSVVFNSRATNLVPGGTTAAMHVFVWDRDSADPETDTIPSTGTITHVSVGPGGGQGDGNSGGGELRHQRGWQMHCLRLPRHEPHCWRD
jgi:Tol biopolymer transport system component